MALRLRSTKVDPNYTVPENGDVSNVAIEANKVDEGTTDTVEGQDGVWCLIISRCISAI